LDTRTQVKQYVDIAWRRKWWLVVPILVGTAGSLYYYKVAPKLYSAFTTVLVTRPNVPEDVVRTVSVRVDEQMKTLMIQILSPTTLAAVARENGLIDDNTDDATKERVTARIKGSVLVDLDKKDLAWFKITVKDRDRRRAAKIANRLAEMFIEKNTESRVKQASENTSLLGGWVAEAEASLKKKDEEISRFKQEHMYELPEQQDSTLQLISVSRDRVGHLSSEIQSKTDRLALLQSEEKASRAVAAASGVNVVVDDPDSRTLVQLQNELNDLLVSYTDENPMVKRKRDQIEQFKATHPALAAAKTSDAAEPRTSLEAKRLQLELRNLESDRSREEAQLQIYTARLANMPLRAQQLENLTRGYDITKRDYETRAGQKEGAKRSQEVEEAKKGQQFTVQDIAYPPAFPSEPVLIQFLFLGIIGGVGVGVGITALLEFLDQSVRTEEQFAMLFPDVVVLGSIPNLVAAAPVKPSAKRKSVNKKKVAAS
jgi:polysaccharide chain length determinant protein (PEP-CTERM system associated)